MASSSAGTVAVVGAGLSGLVCARKLRDAGYDVCVFDKSRGVGGRLATRRADYGTFDHGAQYFTARDPRFRMAVDQWLADGVVAVWSPKLVAIDAAGDRPIRSPVGDSTLRHVGVPSMNRIARALAEGLELRTGSPVSAAHRVDGQWQLSVVAESGQPGSSGAVPNRFDWLAVATPSPQAAGLFADAPSLRAQALALPMIPCWALLARFDSPLPVDYDAAFVNGCSLTWIARNNAKPGREEAECWVLHAARDWSEAELERSPESIVAPMLAEFRRVTDVEASPVTAVAHRWRYSGPGTKSHAACLFDAGLRAGACGDWLAGSRVEGAYLSGLALAENIIAAGSHGDAA